MSNLAGLGLVSVGHYAGGFGCDSFLDAAALVALLFAGSTVMVIALIVRGARRRREAWMHADVRARGQLAGAGVGVGAMLRAEGDGLHIESIAPGGGAAAAGLAPGDVILAVNDAYVGTVGIDGSIQNLRGPEGSAVRLTVRKAGQVVEVMVGRIKV